MKTYKLSQPLDRKFTTIKFRLEDFMYKQCWYVFNPDGISEQFYLSDWNVFKILPLIKVHSNGTESNDSSLGNFRQGKWKYKGDDLFLFDIDGCLYRMHLVSIDSSLIIFELGDTKQYFILVSKSFRKKHEKVSLLAIERHLGLPCAVSEGDSASANDTLSANHSFDANCTISNTRPVSSMRTAEPGTHQGFFSRIINYVFLGGMFHAILGGHDHDKEHTEKTETKPTPDALLDENLYYDELADELADEFADEFADGGEYYDEADEGYYDDSEECLYGDPEDYGGLTEEEVIYDYLQSQEDDDY